jgi:hypothetical protein
MAFKCLNFVVSRIFIYLYHCCSIKELANHSVLSKVSWFSEAQLV